MQTTGYLFQEIKPLSMPKRLPLFILVSFLSFVHAYSQVPGTAKIALSPSMVVNESGHGDATLLVDEQGVAGDPLGGSGGSPGTYWFPGWQSNLYPASAYIDLGGAYELSHVFLYDFTGNSDFAVEVGGPGNWTHLFTDDMSSYNTWERHDVNVTTQYIRVTRTRGWQYERDRAYGRPVGIDQGKVPDSIENQALVDLYNSTNGDEWTDRTNWLQGNTSADFATWHGITVENGDITEIDLSSKLGSQ